MFNTGTGTQPGRIVTPPSRWGNNYHVTNGRRSNFGYSYHGRHHRHWTHRCWSRHHRCWTYWDGGRRCYYYWCSPDACFYPVSHCPHNTYSWSDDSFCVTSCTAVDCLVDDPTTVAVEEAAPSEQDVEYGMQILELLDGTAMDRGMKVGDIIVSLGGQATPDFDALRAALESAGGEADVDFINTDNGQLERVRLYPDETRIGVTVEPVALPEIAAAGGTDEGAGGASGNQDPVAGSTWNGKENLAGFGKLQFTLDADGRATMIDAKSTTVGNWTRNGAEVSIAFVNCLYRGRLTGNRLAGTAEFISGPDEGKTWSFTVER